MKAPRPTRILLLSALLLLAAGCKPSPEEKTREVITKAMWESLYYPGTYLPLESAMDSVWTPDYHPDAVDLRRELREHDEALYTLGRKLQATEETIRLWKDTESAKRAKKIREASAFQERIQAEYDSLRVIRDGKAARLDSIGKQPRRFLGHLVNLRYACVTEDKDTVYAREYLLLDSAKTAVIRQWKEKDFTRP